MYNLALIENGHFLLLCEEGHKLFLNAFLTHMTFFTKYFQIIVKQLILKYKGQKLSKNKLLLNSF